MDKKQYFFHFDLLFQAGLRANAGQLSEGDHEFNFFRLIFEQ